MTDEQWTAVIVAFALAGAGVVLYGLVALAKWAWRNFDEKFLDTD